jgi:hypothetical protein
MDKKNVTIQVSASMYTRLQLASAKAGFPSIGDFITFVLHQIFPEEVEGKDLKEKEMIERKLRDLGYM